MIIPNESTHLVLWFCWLLYVDCDMNGSDVNKQRLGG